MQSILTCHWGYSFCQRKENLKTCDLLQEENTNTIKLEDAPEEPQLGGILPIIQLGTIYLVSN